MYIKGLLIIIAIGFWSCGQSLQNKENTLPKEESHKPATLGLPTVGEKIEGDFNGDGQVDFASAAKVKEGRGNPVEDGTADEYELQFSVTDLKPINVGCCSIRLVNEGDLNNDGADDLSVYQAPMNGCTYIMTSYSFKNGLWKKILEPFLIPTGCDHLTDKALQERIFMEDNVLYYYETDPNDESGKLIRKRALKQ